MKKIALCNRIVVILVQIIAFFEIFTQKNSRQKRELNSCVNLLIKQRLSRKCARRFFSDVVVFRRPTFTNDQFFLPSVGFMPSKTILCPIERASASFSEVFTVQRITGSFVLIGNSPI